MIIDLNSSFSVLHQLSDCVGVAFLFVLAILVIFAFGYGLILSAYKVKACLRLKLKGLFSQRGKL